MSMKIKSSLKTLALLLGLATAAQAESPAGVIGIPNSLEFSVRKGEDGRVLRTRTFTTLALRVTSNGYLGWDGFNEVEQFPPSRETYLGKQFLSLRKGSEGKEKFGVAIKTDALEIHPRTSIKAAFRDERIPRWLTYGYAEAGLNSQQGELVFLLGKEHKRAAIELINFVYLPYHEKPSVYTEFQASFNLLNIPHSPLMLAAVARAEMDNYHPEKKRCTLGLMLKK